MNYSKILLVVLIFYSCDTTSKWEVKGKYYEIVDGLHSEILTTWKNKSAFCEIYSTVVDHHNDTSFIVVLQTPRFENYRMGVSSFLGIRYDAYKNNYKTKDLYQKIYWNNYSDSINELVINSNKQIIENEYKINSIKHQQYIANIADSLIANNPFHKKVFEHKENYWIIDLKIDSLYGPYQKQEYLDQKEKLGVSKKLKLDGE